MQSKPSPSTVNLTNRSALFSNRHTSASYFGLQQGAPTRHPIARVQNPMQPENNQQCNGGRVAGM